MKINEAPFSIRLLNVVDATYQKSNLFYGRYKKDAWNYSFTTYWFDYAEF
ncbi:hypothetical protein SRABI96_01000 [Peribacillus sp. Bi96]|nr:hypothetical protein SRABI96_01000 [Peribacillus sp. Bi96]